MPSGAEADTVKPVVAAWSPSPEVDLLDREVGGATVVVAARVSTEPLPPSVGMAKVEVNTVSAAGEIGPRAVRLLAVTMEAEPRATSLPEEAERPSIVIRGSCVRKS